MRKDDNLNYNDIINNLQEIKKKEESKQNGVSEKFCWMKLLKKFQEKYSNVDKMKREKIKEMLNKYCINLKDYLRCLYSLNDKLKKIENSLRKTQEGKKIIKIKNAFFIFFELILIKCIINIIFF